LEEGMALLLLGLGLSLVSAQEFNPRAVVRKNYDMAKVSGVWYSVSMASDDMKRIEENGDLRVFIRKIESLRDGGLKFHFYFMVQGECVQVAVVCDRTDKDGEYAISYEGDNKVWLSETDYTLYITFHLRNIRNGTETNVLALYGRVQDLSPSFLKRFEKVCRKYGLGPQNIISLSNQSRSHRLPHQQPWAGGRGAGASRGAPGSQGWGWRPQGGPVCEPALSSQITVSNTSRGTQPGLPVRELHGGAGGGGGTGCGGRKLDRRGPASANPTLPVPSGVVASEHTCQCPGATDWELCHHRIHSSQLWRPESEVKVQTAALLPEALAASAGSTHPCAYGRAPPVSALVFTRLLLCLCLSSSSL
uniref:Uncharacterized LOC100465175 n=2 Tax=Ailuropoda melanoleuca TaxID=9646 RepID=G1L9G3_AILME